MLFTLHIVSTVTQREHILLDSGSHPQSCCDFDGMEIGDVLGALYQDTFNFAELTAFYRTKIGQF